VGQYLRYSPYSQYDVLTSKLAKSLIVSIMEEVLVIEKRLVLKEELYIRKRRVETHRPQQVILRSEEVCVERLEATG